MMELACPKICRVSTRVRPRTSHGVGPVCRWERMMSQLAGRQVGGAPLQSRGGWSFCPIRPSVDCEPLPRHGKDTLPHLVYRFKCYPHLNTLIDKPTITFDQMSGYTSPSQVDRLNPMSQGCREVVQGHVPARIFLHHCIHAAQPEKSL